MQLTLTSEWVTESATVSKIEIAWFVGHVTEPAEDGGEFAWKVANDYGTVLAHGTAADDCGAKDAAEGAIRDWASREDEEDDDGQTLVAGVLYCDCGNEMAPNGKCPNCDDVCACGESLDDGEGFDGECGNCADRTEARRLIETERECPDCQGQVYSVVDTEGMGSKWMCSEGHVGTIPGTDPREKENG